MGKSRRRLHIWNMFNDSRPHLELKYSKVIKVISCDTFLSNEVISYTKAQLYEKELLEIIRNSMSLFIERKHYMIIQPALPRRILQWFSNFAGTGESEHRKAIGRRHNIRTTPSTPLHSHDVIAYTGQRGNERLGNKCQKADQESKCGNLSLRYSVFQPPAFDITSIPTSLRIWMGSRGNDALEDVTDPEQTVNELKSRLESMYLEDYGHVDFILSVNAYKDIPNFVSFRRRGYYSEIRTICATQDVPLDKDEDIATAILMPCTLLIKV
ncbi:hypothetical protein C5167_006530 [Papaver somniferum]|uniref:Uncharacterized protein n=1 Tax=Papaver somniferum TaxID=3469 RepID=A0A4Y7JGS5_PAPSO|nr:hypothetical protein C5167_006530 [Papaver somniferum]